MCIAIRGTSNKETCWGGRKVGWDYCPNRKWLQSLRSAIGGFFVLVRIPLARVDDIKADHSYYKHWHSCAELTCIRFAASSQFLIVGYNICCAPQWKSWKWSGKNCFHFVGWLSCLLRYFYGFQLVWAAIQVRDKMINKFFKYRLLCRSR